MEWAIQLITNLVTTIGNYSVIASFLAPFIAADVGILLMGFLSSQNHFSLIIPIIFCSIGLIILDSLWFLSIKSKLFKKIKKKFFKKDLIKTEKQIENISHKKDYLVLFLSKFLFGTRAIVIIYLSSKKKLKYWQFIKYDGIASFLWVLILTIIGWFAGKGFYKISSAYNGLKYSAIILSVVVIISFILRKAITKKLIN